MVSVRALQAGQSGDQAAAGVNQQVVADSLKNTEQMSAAEGCLRFINHAWTQFHAVGESYADSSADRSSHLYSQVPSKFEEDSCHGISGPKYVA